MPKLKRKGKRRTLKNNTEYNDDWMKTLPGYQDEIAIHDELAKNAENGQKLKIFKIGERSRLKGSRRSGNWGHTGKAGIHGGSDSGGGHSQVSASKVPGGKGKPAQKPRIVRKPKAKVKPKEQPKKEPKPAPKPKPKEAPEKKVEKKPIAITAADMQPGAVPENLTPEYSEDYVIDPKAERLYELYEKETGGVIAWMSAEERKKRGIGDDYEDLVEWMDERRSKKLQETYVEGGLSKKQIDEVWRKDLGSGNQTPEARGLQVAVSEEFGVGLSEWQEKHFQKEGVKFLDGDNSARTKIWVRSVYDTTQEKLTEAGFKPGDKVTLYRGFAVPKGGDDIGGRYNLVRYSPGDIIDYQGNAMESWTSRRNVAEKYGDYVMEMSVPVESILSTYVSGFGDDLFSEFVILSVPGGKGHVVGDAFAAD